VLKDSKQQYKLKSLWLFHIAVVFVAFLILIYSSKNLQPINAAANNRINFQGKIVNVTDGTNLITGTPSCVVNGAGNDTCDFRVRIWSDVSSTDTTSGTGKLLFTQTFADVEIGSYNGVFNLQINSCGSSQSGNSEWGTTTGTCTATDDDDVDSDIGVDFSRGSLYLEIGFAPAGSGSYTELFSRKLLNSSPYAFYADSAGTIDGISSSGFVKLSPSSIQATGNVTTPLIHLNEDGSSSPNLLQIQVAGTDRIILNNAGQIQLSTTGNTGGLVIGGDANLYRSGTNQLTTDDGLVVMDDLYVGATAETISNVGFVLNGDDVFINDSLGVENLIYTDGNVFIESGGIIDFSSGLDITNGNISHTSAITFRAVNAISPQPTNDATDYIEFTTPSNTSTIFWQGVGLLTNDPGLRANPATGELEYRDENESSWTSIDSLAAGSGLFTDGGTVTYLTDAAEDFAIGASSLTAPFSVDVSANLIRVGDGANDANDPTIQFFASDATDSGSLSYLDSDAFFFSGGGVYLGSSTNSISNGGFAVGTDGLFINGELGVEGQVYTDGTFNFGNGLVIGTSSVTQSTNGAGDFTISTTGGSSGVLTLDSQSDLRLQADNDTDDYLYLDTTTDINSLFWEGVLAYTNDPGLRTNASTGELEYRDEDSATWVAFDALTGLFTDGGAVTYLTDTADNFAIGATSTTAPFSVTVATNVIRIGDGANDANDPTINFFASDATDSGSLSYLDADGFFFSGGGVYIGANAETLSGAFAIDTNDLFVSDSLGVEGSIYTDNSVLFSTVNRLSIGDSSINAGTSGGSLTISTTTAAGVLTLRSQDNLNLLADNETDDYLYLDTTTNVNSLFWEGVLTYTNDPGVRVGSGGELEYRDEDESAWTSIDSFVAISNAVKLVPGSVQAVAAAANPLIYINETDGSNSPNLIQIQVGGAERFTLNNAGQIQLPVTGNTAGTLLGGDAQIYRGAANEVTITNDNFKVDKATNLLTQGWYNANWTFRRPITIKETMVPESTPLTNFPVLIEFTDSHVQANAQADGDDILFTNELGVKLDHEIESYNSANGRLYAWVEIPVLAATNDTKIYIYYGYSGASNQQSVAGTWASSYTSVWHLEETATDEGTTATHTDSGANAANGTQAGNADIASKIFKGQDFDGTDDYINMGDVTNLDLTDTDDAFITGWFYRETSSSSDTVMAKSIGTGAANTGWIIFIDANPDRLRFYIQDGIDQYQIVTSSTHQFTSVGWNYFAIVWDQDDAANSEVYINGVDSNSNDIGTIANIGDVSNTQPFRIGTESDTGAPFDGNVDELRFTKTIPTNFTTWITAEYNTTNSPSTYTILGSMEPQTNWFNSSWRARKSISINNSLISGTTDLTNFPIVLDITDTNLQAGAKPDASDIVFTSDNGTTQLDHDIDFYDSTIGRLVVWVELPTFYASTPTHIYMYYSNPSAANQEDLAGIWDTSTYAGVWHLNEDPALASPQLKDSTTNLNHGTSEGAMTNGDLIAGKLGNAINFDGSNDDINMGDPANGTLDIDTSDFTLSLWVRGTSAESDTFIAKGASGIDGYKMNMNSSLSFRGGFRLDGPVDAVESTPGSYTAPLNSGNWRHLVTKFDRDGNFTILIDGVERSTASIAIVDGESVVNTANFYLGRSDEGGTTFYVGDMDEVRLTKSVPSNDWFITEYNNQNSPTTNFTVSDAENFAGTGATLFVNATSSRVGINTSNPQNTLHVNGTLKVNSYASASGTDLCINRNVLSSCSSSFRYKENIENLTLGLDTVLNLRPVTFKWRGRDENDLGFVAEETAAVDPLLVTYKEGQIEGVRYNQLTSVLTNAIQQQQTKLIELTTVVDGLMGNSMPGVIDLSELISQNKLVIQGQIYKSRNSVGEAEIVAGDTQVNINFETPYDTIPLIRVTPSSESFLTSDINYTILNKTVNGFTIAISAEYSEDLKFDWKADGTIDGVNTRSDGSEENL